MNHKRITATTTMIIMCIYIDFAQKILDDDDDDGRWKR